MVVEKSDCSPKGKSQGRSRRIASRNPLTGKEVQNAFLIDNQFPPILSLDQASKLAHLAPSTIKRLASEGFFGNSIRRGKPVAFWRDRFVVEVMELDRVRVRNRNARAQNNNQKGGDKRDETNR